MLQHETSTAGSVASTERGGPLLPQIAKRRRTRLCGLDCSDHDKAELVEGANLSRQLPGAFLRSLGIARVRELRQLVQNVPNVPERADFERQLVQLVEVLHDDVEGETFELRPGVQLDLVEDLCLPPLDRRSPERYRAALRARQSYAEYRREASPEACLYFLVSRARARLAPRAAPPEPEPSPARPSPLPPPLSAREQRRRERQREQDEADRLRPDELAAREGWERVQRRAYDLHCIRRWLAQHRPRRE